MEGGNREVQVSVFNYCLSHTSSEFLFLQMRRILEAEMEITKK